jgi:diaminohydroxyphosphoribosylaminopyrimidine deaminase/5-amino-6-(5-phosphoribosylamino)uracil reductase
MFDDTDRAHMAEALRLAERGLYTATPNPRVGCVVVADGEVVGRGFHAVAGGPHAEAVALAAAGDRARGGTAYVTLEPCSHHGRTPPCVDALVHAGIGRVVVAAVDPHPLARHGAERLRGAGVRVDVGLLAEEAEALNRGFVARVTRGRPWVRMKIAASLDGRTALRDGTSQWITSPAARRDGHTWRARACAVLTGIGTLRKDDPRLDVRDVETPRQPLKVLVDSRLDASPEAKLFAGARVLVAAAVEDPARRSRLEAAGAEVVLLPDPRGKVELGDLMRELARRELNEIHVEAGPKLNASLLTAGLVDELLVYLAPSIIGDDGRGMFALSPLVRLEDQVRLTLTEASRIGPDLRVLARVQPLIAPGAAVAAGAPLSA